MNANKLSSLLFVIGCAAIVLGAVDPLEGSVVILGGSAAALAGVLLGKRPHRIVQYWLWTFLLIAIGVGLLFAWSNVGGFGGTSGRSMWWALTLLPYPIGWLMAIAAILRNVVNHWRLHHHPHPA